MGLVPCARCGQEMPSGQILFSPSGAAQCAVCHGLELAAAQEERARAGAARDRPRTVEGLLFGSAARGAVRVGSTKAGRRTSAVVGAGLAALGLLALLQVAGGFSWASRNLTAHGRCAKACTERFAACRESCRRDGPCLERCLADGVACEEPCPP